MAGCSRESGRAVLRGLPIIGGWVVRRVTWPRTERRGQVTHRPPLRGIRSARRTILQGAWPLAGSRRSGQFGPLAGRPGRHSMTVKAALCFADAGPAREGFREALGAVQPRTTLPERTDSHPATGAD